MRIFALLLGLSFVAFSSIAQERVAPYSFKLSSRMEAELRQVFTSDLGWVFSIQGGGDASPLHQRLFGRVDGSDYRAFFEKGVKKVDLHSCGGGLSCVIPLLSTETLYLNPRYNPSLQPQIARVLVYFHAATRLSRQDFQPSAVCPASFGDRKSPLNGMPLAREASCDRSETGIYASMAILMQNISAFCTNCSEKVRMDAHFLAEEMRSRVIDERVSERLARDCF